MSANLSLSKKKTKIFKRTIVALLASHVNLRIGVAVFFNRIPKRSAVFSDVHHAGVEDQVPTLDAARLLFDLDRGWQRAELSTHESRLEKISIEIRDELDRDALGTHRLTLIVIRAIAEAFAIHCFDHVNGALQSFRLSLGKQAQLRGLRCHEEHRRCVGTSRNARSTTDALGGFECRLGVFLCDGDRIRVRRGSRVDREVEALALFALCQKQINNKNTTNALGFKLRRKVLSTGD